MTTVLDVSRSGTQMHAFVVGVGEYPYCTWAAQGVGEVAALGRRLGGIASSSPSALAVARWLVNEQVDDEVAPLGSLELLVSGAPEMKTDHGSVTVEAPTWDNVCRAFDRWYARCDRDQTNIALLFFNGHGFQLGDRQFLLLEDFGHSPQRLLDHAVSLDRTLAGMDECQARTQCYFIDACRDTPPELHGYPTEDARALVSPVPVGAGKAHSWVSRDAISIFSTVPGRRAWGRSDGSVTVFTRALLAALGGLAAQQDQVPGVWDVTTESLWPALRRLLERHAVSEPERQTPAPGLGPTRATALRRLHSAPQIEFRLGCDPSDALRSARIGLSRLDNPVVEMWRHPPVARAWEGSTEAGLYAVAAEFASGYRNKRHAFPFRPPFVDYALPVERM